MKKRKKIQFIYAKTIYVQTIYEALIRITKTFISYM